MQTAQLLHTQSPWIAYSGLRIAFSIVSLVFACLGYLSYAYYVLGIGRRHRGSPPGPPTIPIAGNLFSFPAKWPHYKFTEWGALFSAFLQYAPDICQLAAREYGDIFSLQVMGRTIIVLNTPTAVKEVIDRRSSSSSNRPASYVHRSERLKSF
jgi:hypothetical protein